MPTTSVYGFRYQSLSDAPDGAALGKNLAEDVEAALQGNLALGANLTIAGTLTASGMVLTNPPRLLVRQTVAQTATNSTWTPITFTTEDLDSHNGHSTTVNTSRYTSAVAGWYLMAGKIGWVSNAAGRRVSTWYKNGVEIAATQVALAAAIANDVEVPVATYPVYLAVGDYVELNGYQDSGGSLATIATFPGQQSYMSATWMGPA